jgi:hypothetical protein
MPAVTFIAPRLRRRKGEVFSLVFFGVMGFNAAKVSLRKGGPPMGKVLMGVDISMIGSLLAYLLISFLTDH